MKRFHLAALFAGSLFGAAIFGGAAEATPFELNFTGTVTGGGTITGSISMDVSGPGFTPGAEETNTYTVGASSFHFTINGHTTTDPTAAGSAVTVKGTDNTNSFGTPYDRVILEAHQFGDGLGLNFLSLGTDPSTPLLTLATMPTTLSQWVALFGAATIDGEAISDGILKQFTVTGYTIVTTPVPASVLMFGTALAGLGAAAYRRRRQAGRALAAA